MLASLEKRQHTGSPCIWEHFLSLSNGTRENGFYIGLPEGMRSLSKKARQQRNFSYAYFGLPSLNIQFPRFTRGAILTGESPVRAREKSASLKNGVRFLREIETLKEGSSSAYYRAAILSEWLEDEPGAYSAASTLASALLKKIPCLKKASVFISSPLSRPRSPVSRTIWCGAEFDLVSDETGSAFDADVNSWVSHWPYAAYASYRQRRGETPGDGKSGSLAA